MPINDPAESDSKLSLTHARAMLGHLDVIRQSNLISEDLFEEEMRHVMQRVEQMLRNDAPPGKD